jgi:DNA-binding NarL/FixJ family response regulator
MQTAHRLLDKKTLIQPKVLLIEDSAPDAFLLKRLIESYYPYTLIDYAQSKGEALDFLGRSRYDIVFLDLNLPDSIGVSDVKDIKILAGSTPVIVVTGFYEQAVANDIKSYNVDGIIAKNDLSHANFSQTVCDAITNLQNL